MKGADAEDRALHYLQRQGLTLVQRNFRARGGEIDLVMRERDLLVLVEVRKRSSARYGDAAESVDARKRGRIVLDDTPQKLLANNDVKEFYLGVQDGGERRSMRDIKHYKRRKRWLS